MSINAPFSQQLLPGAVLVPTVTYRVANTLPSVTVYDYWDPPTMIDRVVTGAAMDALDIRVNGDQHEFVFSGPAADLLDSKTLEPRTAGLNQFPLEPTIVDVDFSSVPGHLGQAWLGSTANQFLTVTEASIRIRNSFDLRNQEFGSIIPTAAVPGLREVSSRFSLFTQDDEQTLALYAAAKNQTPISAMLQLGQERGQLMGVYLPNVLPDIPTFDDSETRLQWTFSSVLAHGTADDELYVAFA